MHSRLPNTIYIGPGKTGSTWLFELFKAHPDIYVTPAKDLYFFDANFDRGLSWYASNFTGARNEKIVSEICHDYIVSPEAPARIKQSLADVKIITFLREPVERTYSAYLYRVKHGIFNGTFEEALEAKPEIVFNSLYSQHLRAYIDTFGLESMKIFAFDELQRDQHSFANSICNYLGVKQISLPESMNKPVLKAARARSLPVAKLVKLAALRMRDAGMAQIVGRVKTNRFIRTLLYKDYSEKEIPSPSPETVNRLRDRFMKSVHELDSQFGTDFVTRWRY